MDLLHSATSSEFETIKDICTLIGTFRRFRVGQRADLNLKETEDTSLFKSRWLKKDAVPSIDCAAVVHVCIAPFRRITRRKFAIWHCIWILTHKAQVDIHNHLRHQPFSLGSRPRTCLGPKYIKFQISPVNKTTSPTFWQKRRSSW